LAGEMPHGIVSGLADEMPHEIVSGLTGEMPHVSKFHNQLLFSIIENIPKTIV